MSISTSLKLHIVKKDGMPITAWEVIHLLLRYGWSAIHNGEIAYLPVGDDERYDWRTDVLADEDLRTIVQTKEGQDEVIGVELYWENTSIGITLLRFPDETVLLGADINRVILKDRITDVSWYLERIIPCFEKGILRLSGFDFSQIE